MKAAKRSVALILAFILALGIFTAEAAAQTTPQIQRASDKGDKENVFIFSRSNTYTSFDPTLKYSNIYNIVNQLFYENLITNDYSPDDSYEGELATDWEISEDGLKWTFHLRHDIYYTNGDPFGSDDVAIVFWRIWNIDELSKRKKAFSEYVTDWECPDEYTFVLNLHQTANPDMVLFPMLGNLAIYSAEQYARYGEDMFAFDDNIKPIGTGAFICDKFTVGGDFELVRNHDWWGIGVLGEESNVDRIIFRPISEEGTRIAGVQTGELDWIDNVPMEYQNILGGKNGLIAEQLPSSLFISIMFACDRGLFQDVNARKAAYYAIDRELLALAISGGGEGATWQLPSTCKIGYDFDAVCPEQDLPLAREYLAKTSYNGEPIVMLCSSGLFARSKEVYQAVASMLTEAGFNVDLQILDLATVQTLRAEGKYDLHVVNDVPGSNPRSWLQAWTQDTHNNGYKNDEMMNLLNTAFSTTDVEKAGELIHKAIEMSIEDCAPSMSLYRGDCLIVYREGISNFQYSDARNYFNFSHVQKVTK